MLTKVHHIFGQRNTMGTQEVWYGIFVSVAADITWDLVGTRCFELMLKFPYRLVHRDKLPVALCEVCNKFHDKGHRHASPRKSRSASR